MEELINRICDYIEAYEDDFRIIYADDSEIKLKNKDEEITIYFKLEPMD